MSGRRLLIVVIAAVICLVLLGGAVLAGPAPASRGGYRLEASPWEVQGAAYGPGYRLQGQGSPLQTDSCCCAFLPCLMRGWP